MNHFKLPDGAAVAEMVGAMNGLGAEKASIVLTSENGSPAGAIVVICGADTRNYLDAIDQCERELKTGPMPATTWPRSKDAHQPSRPLFSRLMVAWCWATGLIEFSTPDKVPDGAIVFAEGLDATLQLVVQVLARGGRRESDGQFVVPGVPEAQSATARVDALGAWVDWCAKGNGRAGRHGVVFSRKLT